MKKFYKIGVLVLSVLFTIQTAGFTADVDYSFRDKAEGESVKRVKTSVKVPYVADREDPTPFYYNNELIQPVFRLKMNEGSGNIVKESVSGKEATIVGDDYEWVENAGIRFGSMTPVVNRSNTALKLNTSYINLGKLDTLKFEEDAMTIVYWTNYEIKGRNEDYTEPAWHESKTYGAYKSSYKLDRDIHQILLQCGDLDLSLYNDKVMFPTLGNGSSYNMDYSLVNNAYYNMYYIKIKKSGNVYKAYTSANERMNMASAKAIPGWSKDIFDSLCTHDFYIGTPDPDEAKRSPQMGIADIMIFDGALDYWELMNVYYGYNQIEYQDSRVIQNAE